MCSIRSSRCRETALHLGAPWADQRAPERRFRGLAVVGGELVSEGAEDPYVASRINMIKHAPGVRLKISYRLHEQDNPERLNNSGYFHSPVIGPDHMQLIGWTGLAVPYFGDDPAGRNVKHTLV